MMETGIIYGTASSTQFDVAVSDSSLQRLDYIAVDHEGREVLAQIDDVVRKGGLSYEEAVASDGAGEGRLSASVNVIGYVDDAGRVQTPRTPFAAGQTVRRADEHLVTEVLGLEAGDGAYIGRIANTHIPVRLSMNMLAQKHVSVLAKTGAGKSYTVGVLLEEFLAAGVPLVILDPHGEYGSLRNPNIDEDEVARMAQHRIKPRSFDKQVTEWALDTELNPDAQKLRLEGINLEGREIVDLLGGKLSGGQVGLLYQAVKEVKDNLPGYTLQDIMDVVQQNKSSAKWNVINALEALEGTGVFHISGTEVKDLVEPQRCTIINLKGIAPDVQEVAVTRLTGLLWEARKRGEVPPFILVCEEAHNFCPERGVGNAISGGVIRTVASEGRKFGMGLVIVSQRPAKIDKNVLSQCNTQFVLKVTNPNDLKAIISSVEGITSKAGDEVQRLAVGTALIAGGGLTQPVFVDVRPRLTRHGGRSIDVVGKTAPRKRAVPAEPPVVAPAPPARRAERRSVTPASTPAIKNVQKPAPQVVDDPPAPAREPPTPERPASVPPTDESPTMTSIRVRAQQQEPVAEKQKPVPMPTWSKQDAPDIHRVAHRVGIVGPTRDPEDTIGFIQRLARQNGRNPDMRVGLYAEIGRTVCGETPICIRCPLKESCQHHEQIRTERQKSRSPIRRLWNR